MHARLFVAAFAVVLLSALAPADGPLDNQPDKVRPIPPPGVKIADADRAELQKGVAELGKEIEIGDVPGEHGVAVLAGGDENEFFDRLTSLDKRGASVPGRCVIFGASRRQSVCKWNRIRAVPVFIAINGWSIPNLKR